MLQEAQMRHFDEPTSKEVQFTADTGLNTLTVAEIPFATAETQIEHSTNLLEEQQNKLKDKFGVEIKPNASGQLEYSYRADGKEHLVHSSESTVEGVNRAEAALERIRNGKIAKLYQDHKVEIAAPGEFFSKTYAFNKDCKFEVTGKAHAEAPPIPFLHGLDEAMKRSHPSQLDIFGTGLKVYVLDRNIMPPPYGNKPALGVYEEADKDGRIAFAVTPEGARLPPTENDVENPGDRNIKGVAIHETGHNGQHNTWRDGRLPKDLIQRLGWKLIGHEKYPIPLLEGKSGRLYFHFDDDFDCKTPKSWIAFNEDMQALDENDNPVGFKYAKKYTNDEVSADAVVKPPSYYFPNPSEMLIEGLTTYRTSTKERARLLKESPVLYEEVQAYDQAELKRVYGIDNGGMSKVVRLPEGFVVERNADSERLIAQFEKALRPSGQKN